MDKIGIVVAHETSPGRILNCIRNEPNVIETESDVTKKDQMSPESKWISLKSDQMPVKG